MIAPALLCCVSILAGSDETLETAQQEALQAPTAPLDPRVGGAKMTDQAVPEIAPSIVQPLPAIHRISNGAEGVPCSRENWQRAREAIVRGIAFLRSSQDKSGGWMVTKAVAATDQKQPSLGASTAVTALALKALAQCGLTPATDRSANLAREFIRARLLPAAGSFDPDADGGLGNYVASAVVSGLAATDDAADLALIERSVQWLQDSQWDQSEGIAPAKDWFGGAGYGTRGRPDLSNTQMMLDALHDAQVSPDDPSVARALLFLTRTQNCKATNSAAWAQAGANDGGFIYTPANAGESFSSEAAGEGRYGEKLPEGAPRSLRSYGSMTYAGFKSMLYAGLAFDDPRVQAALGWIRNNWTMNENPGLGQQGYFYYMHAVARALLATTQASITDVGGASHNWRDEMITALLARQRGDGSWVNEASRWEESSPDLCTIYALLALEEALKQPARSATKEPASHQ